MRAPRALPLAAALLLALSPVPSSAQEADQADSDPVTFITAIYKTYTASTTDQPGLPQMYSKRLQGLIDKDASETPEGMVGRIDWDVFVDGQDWRLSKLKISLVSRTDKAAEVRATFHNFDKPCDLLYDLVLEDGHWRVDEIEETLKPRWVMSKILTDAPGGLPDALQSDEPGVAPGTAGKIELR